MKSYVMAFWRLVYIAFLILACGQGLATTNGRLACVEKYAEQLQRTKERVEDVQKLRCPNADHKDGLNALVEATQTQIHNLMTDSKSNSTVMNGALAIFSEVSMLLTLASSVRNDRVFIVNIKAQSRRSHRSRTL